MCPPPPLPTPIQTHSQWQPPTQRQNELGSVSVVDWKWQNLLWLTWHWYKSKQWNWNNNINKCRVIKITHGIPINMCLRVWLCVCPQLCVRHINRNIIKPIAWQSKHKESAHLLDPSIPRVLGMFRIDSTSHDKLRHVFRYVDYRQVRHKLQIFNYCNWINSYNRH